MTVPVQLAFKGTTPSPALEARIREKAAKLSRFAERILGCRVTVDVPHRSHHKGHLYRIRIELAVPRGTVVVTRESPQDHAHEDPYVAVRDAFDAAVRQLEDHQRKLDGRVKHHESPLLHGRIARFVADADYGFIETADGQEVYFHRNSVVDAAFDRLKVGDEVRLAVAEGDKGLQASTVHRVGKHHPTP
jgi:cold shock CspA family protein/ribosome-associated translation inhibitor RaiA